LNASQNQLLALTAKNSAARASALTLCPNAIYSIINDAFPASRLSAMPTAERFGELRKHANPRRPICVSAQVPFACAMLLLVSRATEET
jgi:hypothetical protein